MKLLLIFATAIIVTNAVSDSGLWSDFKVNYSKSYRSLLEEQIRFNIFQSNLRKIELHNQKYEHGDVSYTLGVNQFADLSAEEFASSLMRGDVYKKTEDYAFSVPAGAEAPNKMDWRDQSAVSKVKDQGKCAASYFFATLGAIESHNYISNKEMVDLSEQCLLDCSGAYNGNGCTGSGGIVNTIDFIRTFGVTYEQNYTYSGTADECKNYEKLFLNIGFVLLPKSEEYLQTVIGTVGPVTVTFDGTNIQLYSVGIYDDTSCKSTISSQSGLVVGYDTTSDGQEFWIVKLSYGSSWGEDGYVRMGRNNGDPCGIALNGLYPTV